MTDNRRGYCSLGLVDEFFVKKRIEREDKMESIALTIHNDKIKQEIIDFLKKFPDDEVELMSIEDAEDLHLLQKTRHEDTISFSDYLAHAD